jgi:ABC-2 type transport system ATP-binding protein
MQHAIVIEHLSHRFNSRYALKDLSYEVRQGEIFALLGPNGAGKTTTIRLVNGLYTPTSGRINVLGMDSVRQGSQIRQQTGVLTETSALYERLSARENLLFFGRLYGVPESLLLKRTDEILQFFGLKNRESERAGAYSKGMKQRLALARAFLTHPRILFLDEPTSSLDPESTQQVHELIESLCRQEENTVFLCTHRLEEAERLADRVAILNSGRLLALGSLPELTQQFNHGLWVEVDLLQSLQKESSALNVRGVLDMQVSERKIRAQIAEEAVIPSLVASLVAQKAQIVSVKPQKVTLEEIYFKLQSQAQEGAA